MRRIAVVSAALLIVACGPDPNAVLPGMVKTPSSGGTKPAPAGGAGGTTTTPPSSGGTTGTTSAAGGGSGGANPFAGSSGSSGGATGSGGVKSGGGAGGGTSSGGAVGTGGSTAIGADCTNATLISNGSTPAFGTGAVCFVTCEGSTTYGWGCDSFTEADRTVTVNGTAVKCGVTPLPAAKNGYYYFQIGAGGHTWDAIHLNAASGATCTPPAGGTTGTGGTTGAGGSTGSSTSPPDASSVG